MDLTLFAARDLLQLHNRAAAEIRARGLIRTGNQLCADLAETIVSRTFGWPLNPNSKAGFDATAGEERIESKACRLSHPKASRQTSAIRRIDSRPFDRLLGIVFTADYTVLLALDIPYEVVIANAAHNAHTNSAIFHLRDALIGVKGVCDVTAQVAAGAEALLAERP